MDAYPPDYTIHNLPFICISGLKSSDAASTTETSPPPTPQAPSPLYHANGPRIRADDVPLIEGNVAEKLLEILSRWDADVQDGGEGGLWKARTGALPAFKMKKIGRNYLLPPRKANPPPNSPSLEPVMHSMSGGAPPPTLLHSPISPLSPGSPTFPDGMMTSLWITKHQSLIPSAFVSFLPMTSDPTLASLRDNQLKTQINGMKTVLSSSNHKSRLVVVLVGEDDGAMGDLDERLAAIRRATGLDLRSTLYFVPPRATQAQLEEFCKTLMAYLQPTCVEYYRDLSKHARRKRNRGTIPPPTAPPTSGTSRTLQTQGWNVRYEFKLGVFAEFRQEMDAAVRNYESAYDGLLGQEVFESIASWNPRFNDARMLADVIAIRILRCLLWTGQTTAAVRSWMSHRSRMQDLIDRQGKGTENYGWEAWEARWASVMTELITKADLPPFSPSRGPEFDPAIMLGPEKAIPVGERLLPWTLLHHQGYWLRRSAEHTVLRRALAERIPEEDRVSPGQSPASQLANKSYLYDTYLAPEPHLEVPLDGKPGFNHSQLLLETLESSRAYFYARDQSRTAEKISFDMAKEYVHVEKWTEAYAILAPLWSDLSWRRSGWWELVFEVALVLRKCALMLKEAEMVLRIDWELLNRVFPTHSAFKYDLGLSLDEMENLSPKPSVVVNAEDMASCVTASFSFGKYEGNVGEPLRTQLVLTSHAHKGSAPLSFSAVKIAFEGNLRPIKLVSDGTDTAGTALTQIKDVELGEQAALDPSALQSPTGVLSPLTGSTDLTISPGQSLAFNLTSIPREAGEVQVASVTMLLDHDKYSLTCVQANQGQGATTWWTQGATGPIVRRIGKDYDSASCRILPKPPKVKIQTPNLRQNYYTHERVSLELEFVNDEEEAAVAAVQVRLFGRPNSSTKLEWADLDEAGEGTITPDADVAVEPGVSRLQRRSLGKLEKGSRSRVAVLLTDTFDPVDHELEVSAHYHLVSDPDTPVIKVQTVALGFLRPFEANYDFTARLHPDAWPNFFELPDDDDSTGTDVVKPNGITQRWCLASKIVSFVLEPVVVEEVSLRTISIVGGAVCTIAKETVNNAVSEQMNNEELRDSEFIVDVQKLALEDRRSVTLDLALDIRWRRADTIAETATSTTTILAVPSFLIPSSEPRVLATATSSTNPRLPSPLINLTYTLENPSMYFLTFTITLESSEDFAFSGPKTTTIQLVPLSRTSLKYKLLPSASAAGKNAKGRSVAAVGGVWIRPNLVVMDVVFNKTLRVLGAGGPLVRNDKRGVEVWVDAVD